MTITPSTPSDLRDTLTAPGTDVINAQFTAAGQRMTTASLMPARVGLAQPIGAQDGDAPSMLQARDLSISVGFEMDLRTVTRVEMEEGTPLTPGRRVQTWWAYGPEGRAFYWVELAPDA